MPYNIQKRGSKWAVVKDSGKVVALHDSEEKAKSQMRLLYAIEKKA